MRWKGAGNKEASSNFYQTASFRKCAGDVYCRIDNVGSKNGMRKVRFPTSASFGFEAAKRPPCCRINEMFQKSGWMIWIQSSPISKKVLFNQSIDMGMVGTRERKVAFTVWIQHKYGAGIYISTFVSLTRVWSGCNLSGEFGRNISVIFCAIHMRTTPKIEFLPLHRGAQFLFSLTYEDAVSCLSGASVRKASHGPHSTMRVFCGSLSERPSTDDVLYISILELCIAVRDFCCVHNE